MKATTVDKTNRTEALRLRDSKASSLCCKIGGFMGFVLFAIGFNVALGGVFADLRFQLSGIELPLSCLGSSMALLGVFLVAVTRRTSGPVGI